MSVLGKTNLKSISNNLAKMAINWHKIGQMPLLRMNINLVIFHPILTLFFSKLFFLNKSNGDKLILNFLTVL